MKFMVSAEKELIEVITGELKTLAENGYTFFDLACYVEEIIDETSQSHSTAYFRYLNELKDIFMNLAENDK